MTKLTLEELEIIKELVRETVAETVPEAMSSVFENERETETHIIAQIVTETYRVIIEQEAIEVARIHGKMLELTQMILEITSRDHLDVRVIGDEANKRAYALAVMMAEQSVIRNEDELATIDGLIAEGEMAVINGGHVAPTGVESTYENRKKWDVRRWESRMRTLLKQRDIVANRLDAERQRLFNLKL